MLLDFLYGGLVDQGPCRTPGSNVAHFKFFDCSDEFLGKSIINSGLDVESVGANTGLTGVAVLGNDRPFDSRIQIRIVEDDNGAFRLSSNESFLMVLALCFMSSAAHLGRTR